MKAYHPYAAVCHDYRPSERVSELENETSLPVQTTCRFPSYGSPALSRHLI